MIISDVKNILRECNISIYNSLLRVINVDDCLNVLSILCFFLSSSKEINTTRLSFAQIRDGYFNTFSSLLATLCGYHVPTEPIVTTQSSAVIKFTANSRFEGSKFRLRFSSVDTRNASSVVAIHNSKLCIA